MALAGAATSRGRRDAGPSGGDRRSGVGWIRGGRQPGRRALDVVARRERHRRRFDSAAAQSQPRRRRRGSPRPRRLGPAVQPAHAAAAAGAPRTRAHLRGPPGPGRRANGRVALHAADDLSAARAGAATERRRISMEPDALEAVGTGNNSQATAPGLRPLLQKTSRTFALSIPLLPEPLQTEVAIAYLLFRIIDTFEDATRWAPARRAKALAPVRAADEERRPVRLRELTAQWLADPAARPCRLPRAARRHARGDRLAAPAAARRAASSCAATWCAARAGWRPSSSASTTAACCSSRRCRICATTATSWPASSARC